VIGFYIYLPSDNSVWLSYSFSFCSIIITIIIFIYCSFLIYLTSCRQVIPLL
jgi:hypothetical protein